VQSSAIHFCYMNLLALSDEWFLQKILFSRAGGLLATPRTQRSCAFLKREPAYLSLKGESKLSQPDRALSRFMPEMWIDEGAGIATALVFLRSSVSCSDPDRASNWQRKEFHSVYGVCQRKRRKKQVHRANSLFAAHLCQVSYHLIFKRYGALEPVAERKQPGVRTK
jgi:hypothetical protein